MLTFELPWPPFCRNKRFLSPPNLQMLTSSCPEKLKIMKMLNSHFHDFESLDIHFFADVSFFVWVLLLLFFSSSCSLSFFALASFFCFFDLEAKEQGRQRERKKRKEERQKEREKWRKQRRKERKEGKKGKKERKEGRKEGRKERKKDTEKEERDI